MAHSSNNQYICVDLQRAFDLVASAYTDLQIATDL